MTGNKLPGLDDLTLSPAEFGERIEKLIPSIVDQNGTQMAWLHGASIDDLLVIDHIERKRVTALLKSIDDGDGIINGLEALQFSQIEKQRSKELSQSEEAKEKSIEVELAVIDPKTLPRQHQLQFSDLIPGK